MKVVLVNIYEYSYLGTRCLAAYLQENGIETHNIIFQERPRKCVASPSPDAVFGYHVYTNGRIYEDQVVGSGIPSSPEAIEALKQALRDQNPDIIGFSSRSTYNPLAPEFAQIFRETAPAALLVAGGFGPTLEPDVYFKAGFDCVVRGDGEEALLEICLAWNKNDRNALLHVPNSCWSKTFGGFSNPMRDQKKDISAYPAPLSGNPHFSYIDQDGILHSKRDPILQGEAYFTFFGRGCIGTCAYCSGGNWSTLYRNEGKKAYKRRNRAIDDVIEELKNLPANIKRVVFADEYWGNSSKVTFEFFTKYKKHVRIPFFAYLNYDQVVNEPELFTLILDAGLLQTGVGFQTGSYELAKKYYNRKQDYKLLLDYTWLMFRNKVSVNPQFIGGNCYETKEDFLKTLDVIRQLPFDIESPYSVQLQCNQLKPHPGSPLLELAPRVASHPMATKEWHFRAILMDMARIITEEEVEYLWGHTLYRNDPLKLQELFNKLLLKRQYAHYKKLINESGHKRWLFYGANASYHKNKDFFKSLGAEALLLDKEFICDQKTLDGLPVRDIDEFFASNIPDDFQVMIFSAQPWWLGKKLLRTHKVPFENIHSCASNWSSPFSAEKVEEIESFGDVCL
ncbi:cobalamin-dependent protein [Desulfovibrio sp.]|uniref:B12-binding domain-containing radical SAM protein n=1 Tax=Desulfovibrio sp. TaxID=885 RepID=UPI0023CB1AF8|nr:cobalamin-dependent protein [Desulfovibrio sp.]MDE7240788.1 cobalamin-dependent protein [Desulfovibrio sp.]